MTFEKFEVSAELKTKCWQHLKKNNMGQRGNADGDSEQQLTGLIAEVLVYESLLGKPYQFKTTFDGGLDFIYEGSKIDVKTMGRSVCSKPEYINNLFASQLNYEADTLVFCSLNKTDLVLEVCGWITKEEFLRKAKFYTAGQIRKRGDGTEFPIKAHNYEIANSDLNPYTQLVSWRRDNIEACRRICDNSMEYAIGIYLREGEVRGTMLEKFSNDKIKLVQFLREREFEKYKK
jgi:hypothetical protein